VTLEKFAYIQAYLNNPEADGPDGNTEAHRLVLDEENLSVFKMRIV
jgi:hypothetical protein